MRKGLCPDMPLLVNDWLSSTSITMMTPAEEGALIRLLCHAWNEPDCSLPDDDSMLAKLSRLGRQWRKGSGAKIRGLFVPHPERQTRLVNLKQRTLRLEQEGRLQAASQHGSNAAKARWNRHNVKPETMPEQCGSIPPTLPDVMPKDASSPVSRLSDNTHTQGSSAVTLEVVKSEAANVGLPEGEAERCFAYWQQRRWTDKHGQPVDIKYVVGTWTPKGNTHGRNRTKRPMTETDHKNGF